MPETAKAMVLASFCGDGLALAPHWIYDPERIKAEFGRVSEFTAPRPGSFHAGKAKGELTHYGDQTLVLLESLAAQKGFDLSDFAERWQAMLTAYAGYRDVATTTTLANFADGWGPGDAGSQSDDLAGAARVAPVVYAYAGDLEHLAEAARSQARLTHNNAGVMAASELLAVTAKFVLDRSEPQAALSRAAERPGAAKVRPLVAQGLAAAGTDSRTAILGFGQSCHLEAALPSVVQLICRHPGDLAEALIQSVMAGGDSAARNMCVGLVLGAHLGLAAIPESWLNALVARERIETLLTSLD